MADEPDGMLAYMLAIQEPNINDPAWPLPSFDARDWAKSFCKKHPDIDEGEMIAWFACALMRGFDEHGMRMEEQSAGAAGVTPGT